MAKLYLPCLTVYKGQFICKTFKDFTEELKGKHGNQRTVCTVIESSGLCLCRSEHNYLRIFL